MEQSKNIIDFFERFIRDDQMYPSHISLYVALFQLWSNNRFQNPFRICRKDAMQLSKIRSFATYHKCINEIHNAGFITYAPNFNSYQGSLVQINDIGSNMGIVRNQKKMHNEVSNFIIPNLYDVELYFNERDVLSEEAMQFHLLYQSRDWRLINDKPMICWRSAARNWISKVKNKSQNQNL